MLLEDLVRQITQIYIDTDQTWKGIDRVHGVERKYFRFVFRRPAGGITGKEYTWKRLSAL